MEAKGYLLWTLLLALVFLGALAFPYSLLARLNAERVVVSPPFVQALYLAEAGAREAIAAIQADPQNPPYAPQPVLVCRASSPCSASSSDYIGRYCYSSGTLGGFTCSVTRSTGGGITRFTIVAVGESQSSIGRVRVVYNQTEDQVESWEVNP